MNINKLQTFKVLSETLSFTKTGEILFTSQPNVTKQIKSLEEELGYSLIHRTHKTFQLTEYGHLFYKTCKVIVEELEHGLQNLHELQNTTNHSIIIGATPFIGSKILPALLPLLNEAFADYQVTLKVDRSKVILKDLESRKIHLAFFSEYIPINLDHFIEKNVYEDSLMLICNPDHPLSHKKKCKFEDLIQERYISKGNQSSLHRFLSNQLGSPTFMQKHLFVVDNQYSIKEAVAHGLGISIVSELLVKKDIENGLLSKLSIEDFELKRNIKIVYPKNYDKKITSIIENIMPTLKETI